MIEYTVNVTSDYTEWYLNGKLHRTDGPAVAQVGGHKSWYINGELHRTDGPAFEGLYGYKAWYIHGKLHRTDGPAIEYANGTKQWWINDIRVTEADVMSPTKEMTMDELEAVLGHKLKVIK